MQDPTPKPFIRTTAVEHLRPDSRPVPKRDWTKIAAYQAERRS